MVTVKKTKSRIERALVIDAAAEREPARFKLAATLAASLVWNDAKEAACAKLFKDYDLEAELAKFDPLKAKFVAVADFEDDDDNEEHGESEKKKSSVPVDGSEVKKEKRQIRTLNIFADGEAMKLAQRLYFNYISQTDAGAFTTFLSDLDKMMSEYRDDSKDPINLEPEEETEEEDEDGGGEDSEPQDEDEYDGVSKSTLRKILSRIKQRREMKKKNKM